MSFSPLPLFSTAVMLGGSVILMSCTDGTSVAAEPGILAYTGAADGSAAVAVDKDHFIAASDENCVLRVYRRDSGGQPEATLDLTAFLTAAGGDGDSDIEAATRIGSRSYWITSHGRSKSGKEKPGQCRFFALDPKPGAGPASFAPVGKAYTRLLEDLTTEPKLSGFHLLEASRLAPKEPGGLSIEGLCATPEGHLLIGFRNPVPEGKALLVPLLNPAELPEGKKAVFGEAVVLDLAGFGIRDMAWSEGRYYLIAGAPGANGGKSRLYTWTGGKTPPQPVESVNLKGFNAEGIVFYPEIRDGLELLTDDSSKQVKGSPESLSFRGRWVPLSK